MKIITQNILLSPMANNHSKGTKDNCNPFGLVYKGAITKNESGAVNIEPVSYQFNGIEIAANVYFPANE